jgi:hypothetical protein
MSASIETPAVIYITLLYRFRIIREHSNLSLHNIEINTLRCKVCTDSKTKEVHLALYMHTVKSRSRTNHPNAFISWLQSAPIC